MIVPTNSQGNVFIRVIARPFAVDEHLEFLRNEEGTIMMFARERRSPASSRMTATVGLRVYLLKHNFLVVDDIHSAR